MESGFTLDDLKRARVLMEQLNVPPMRRVCAELPVIMQWYDQMAMVTYREKIYKDGRRIMCAMHDIDLINYDTKFWFSPRLFAPHL